jgi:hypothetical protein
VAVTDPAGYEELQPIVAGEVARLQEAVAVTRLDQGAASSSDLAALEDRSRRLAAEVLSFSGGLAARADGLDAGMCDAADTLLAEVTAKLLIDARGVTLPAAGEYVDLLSEVIRVRYPGDGVWDLPVCLHELGHFMAPRLGASRPGGSPVATRIAAERAKRPNLGNFAEELFADTFATYVGGPAYAYSCLLLRLNPSGAHDDVKPTHPAPIKRAVAVLTTLDALQEAHNRSGRAAGSFGPFIADVRQAWSARLAAAAEASDASAEAAAYASELATELRALLDDLAVVVRYDGLGRAGALEATLVEGRAPPGPVALIDALNGAWMARRRAELGDRPDHVDAITDGLTALCARITGNG